jgi:hypothetical protein
MNRFKFFKIGIFTLASLFVVSTAFAGGLPDEWAEIDPADYGFEYNGLTPACTNAPGTTSDKFTFFVKGGTKNKIVIFFQGGGACWASTNCLYFPTCTQQQGEVLDDFYDPAKTQGIFDLTNSDNPFKDWGFVYIPYCTGDLFWGAQDTEYPDSWFFFGGVPQTIQHRGFVNFQAVLRYLKDNVCWPRKIFVTGSSAGSYGATNAFPFIKQAYPLSRVYLLGDAGNGVLGGTFPTGTGVDENGDPVGGIYNWNIQLPTWIPYFENGYDPTMTMEGVYTSLAAEYPWMKVAQYTTAYDGTQAGFLQVMLNIDDPGAWTPTPRTMCEWNSTMIDYSYNTAAESPNYRYYIAAGLDHTILMSPKFYTEESAGGIPFYKWVEAMVRNPFGTHSPLLQGKWKNLECEDCESPLPPGVPCEYLP